MCDHKIEVTPEMINAGKSALWDAMGYQLDGDPSAGVEAAFLAMFFVWLKTCNPTVSTETPTDK